MYFFWPCGLVTPRIWREGGRGGRKKREGGRKREGRREKEGGREGEEGGEEEEGREEGREGGMKGGSKEERDKLCHNSFQQHAIQR